jgi:hypothetical protein
VVADQGRSAPRGPDRAHPAARCPRHRDLDFTAAVRDHYEPLFAAWRGVVERARLRGEVTDDTDADSVMLSLVSPLVLVPLLWRQTLTADEVDRVVALVLRATATGVVPHPPRTTTG